LLGFIKLELEINSFSFQLIAFVLEFYVLLGLRKFLLEVGLVFRLVLQDSFLVRVIYSLDIGTNRISIVISLFLDLFNYLKFPY
jgi:hypothetical protein